MALSCHWNRHLEDAPRVRRRPCPPPVTVAGVTSHDESSNPVAPLANGGGASVAAAVGGEAGTKARASIPVVESEV